MLSHRRVRTKISGSFSNLGDHYLLQTRNVYLLREKTSQGNVRIIKLSKTPRCGTGWGDNSVFTEESSSWTQREEAPVPLSAALMRIKHLGTRAWAAGARRKRNISPLLDAITVTRGKESLVGLHMVQREGETHAVFLSDTLPTAPVTYRHATHLPSTSKTTHSAGLAEGWTVFTS